MDEALVTRWNDRIAPKDDVWHLGDFAVLTVRARRENRAARILDRLHGHVRLIAGNNDDETRGLDGWVEVADYVEITLDGVPLVLCHYPLRTWRNSSRGWWNLHGHSHGKLKPLTRQRDVGVDCRDYGPVTLEELLKTRM